MYILCKCFYFFAIFPFSVFRFLYTRFFFFVFLCPWGSDDSIRVPFSLVRAGSSDSVRAYALLLSILHSKSHTYPADDGSCCSVVAAEAGRRWMRPHVPAVVVRYSVFARPTRRRRRRRPSDRVRTRHYGGVKHCTTSAAVIYV